MKRQISFKFFISIHVQEAFVSFPRLSSNLTERWALKLYLPDLALCPCPTQSIMNGNVLFPSWCEKNSQLYCFASLPHPSPLPPKKKMQPKLQKCKSHPKRKCKHAALTHSRGKTLTFAMCGRFHLNSLLLSHAISKT